MRTRKEMKRQAKKVVHEHYWILLIVCLVAVYMGAEFSGSLDFVKQYRQENNGASGQIPPTRALTDAYHPIFTQAVWSALAGDVDGGREMAETATEQAIQNAEQNRLGRFFGRSRGVFASIINGIDSGSIIVNLISAAQGIGMSQNGIVAVFIGVAALLLFGIWFFLINMYKAISRRIFLETRTYKKVPIRRMLFFYRVKRWRRVSVTMFMTWLLQSLWSLTVIGGLVKRYSYYMVPYIAAENPDIGWKDTITLSRKMMVGHKWECFVFECTFILWNLAGIVTLGISNLFYANQYKVAAFSEYYADIRAQAKKRNISGSELLNDKYLFKKAERRVLRETYADVPEMSKISETEITLGGFRGFIANVFGVTLYNRADEMKFAECEERKLKRSSVQAILNGEQYPGRLFPIGESERNSQIEHLHYLRHYSVSSLILLFFIFSLIGWIWEVCLHLVSDGTFVNRGVLHGPWLPIYGAGGVLILVLLNKFRKHPIAEFFAAVLLCGCVEYFTAYVLELLHDGQKWWDYSGYFLNLHGRICAEGLLVFGLGGMAIVYFLAPLLDNYLRKLDRRLVLLLCAVLLLVFNCDRLYSKKHPNMGEGITSYTVQEESVSFGGSLSKLTKN